MIPRSHTIVPLVLERVQEAEHPIDREIIEPQPRQWAAMLFFQLMTRRYEQASTVLTSK